MAVSVTLAVSRAFDHMKRILFQPFDLGKWFVLGFCAFLAHLTDGGGSGNFHTGSGRGGGGGGSPGDTLAGAASKAEAFVREHLPLVLLLGLIALVLVVGLSALLTWLSSRGRFLFLDGVVRNRGAVKEPWHQFRPHGNDLFVFEFLLGLGFAALSLLLLGGALLWVWPDVKAGTLPGPSVGLLVAAAALFVLAALALALFRSVLHDFVVPIMYRRGMRTVEALGVFRHEVLPGRLGALAVFYLLKIVLSVAGAMFVLLVTCLTCCIGALPYLSSVVALPVSVFFRAYSLCFLEQIGEHWRFFPRPPPGRPFYHDAPSGPAPSGPRAYYDGPPPREL